MSCSGPDVRLGARVILSAPLGFTLTNSCDPRASYIMLCLQLLFLISYSRPCLFVRQDSVYPSAYHCVVGLGNGHLTPQLV
jgi:hypothetical protein